MAGALLTSQKVAHSPVIFPIAGMPPVGPVEREDIRRALRSLRRHLQMEVAFISQFSGTERIFIEVDTDLDDPPIAIGMSIPMEEGYCQRIVDGRLPYLIPDTGLVPEALEIAATLGMPIGSHISVPLIFSDGRVYGTFYCFGRHSDLTLHNRDLAMLRAVAELTSHHLEHEEKIRREASVKSERIRTVIASGGPEIVFQPIVLLADMRVIGVEALSRFSAEPRRTPDFWFAEAGEVGLKVELEKSALDNAIAEWSPLWRQTRLNLSLNCSAETVLSGVLETVFEHSPVEMIILEITEHDEVDDYDLLNRSLAPLRAQGLRLAIDDAGSGYASMRHILNTRPDIIKLDVSLTRDIDRDAMRRSLAGALVRFAEGFEGNVVAEGVEKESDLDALRVLGVRAAQGYHIARPLSLEGFHQFLSSR